MDTKNKQIENYTSLWEKIKSHGAIGPQGPKGDQGEPGPQGPQGERGEKGEPGHSGSYFPDLVFFGKPTIQGSQIGGFSTDNYCQFPFLVDFKGLPWVLNFSITTCSDVAHQHNIFDSDHGIAFAIKNGKFILAISTDGVDWTSGELHGKHTVVASTTYQLRMSWNQFKYTLDYYDSLTEQWVNDIEWASEGSAYPKQVIVGKDLANQHPFDDGSIELANANLTIADQVVWEGMAEVGTATRMATDLSNIDEAGINRLRHLSAPSMGETTNYTVEMGKIYNLGTVDGATITLAQSGLITGEVPQWHFYFTAGANAPRWLVPITWKPAFDLTVGTLYEVDIQQMDGTYYGRVDGFDA